MMKKRIIAVLLITVMAWLLPVPYAMAENTGISQTENDAAAEAADNQVVVIYEEGEMPSEASEAKTEKAQEKILEKAQSGILDEALSGDYSIDETIVIGTEDNAENDLVVGVVSSNDFTTDELVEKLQESESVKFAEPNYVYKAKSMPAWNDNYIKDAWQLGGDDVHGVNVASAPVPASDGDPVVIAVLDTGIDYEHPDLKDRMWDAPDNYKLKKGIHGIDYSDGDADPMDENGHGTHCAGIIAAAADNGTGSAGVAGKSDKIELMAVRVLDAEGAGYLEDIVKGFRHIVRARQEGVNVKAINCSLGAETSSDIFDAVIEQAGQNGILTIAAAGNDAANNDSALASPANSKSDYVISVAASNRDGRLASYTNYGRKTVDVAAPGSNILSSVSYYNYAPYLYDANTIADTTRVYGEFADSDIVADGEGNYSVKPVPGTDYNGSPITGIGEFGESVMKSILEKGSNGKASLVFTDETSPESFGIGNNGKSLRWKIEDASEGDVYLLYFPYEKLIGDDECNVSAVFRTNTGDGDEDGTGTVCVGDIKIDDEDSAGNISWQSSAEQSEYMLPVMNDWNSIWQATSYTGVLYDKSSVNGLDAEKYGFGFAYLAESDGDAYIDISSVGIARRDADEKKFGQYDVLSGTSMATPVVAGAVGVIAAANPGMDAESLKATLLATTRRNDNAAGKVSSGSIIDFENYKEMAETAKPSISSVTADFEAGVVTIKGRGFTDSSTVKVYKPASDKPDTPIDISEEDIEVSDGNTIKISKAGYGKYGIIGSDVRFAINNGEEGEGSFYVVKGLTPYTDEYKTALEAEEEFSIWKNSLPRWEKNVEDDSSVDGELVPVEEELADPVMPRDLKFVAGANDLYKYDEQGDIYYLSYNKTANLYTVFVVGGILSAELTKYADETGKSCKYWAPDNGETNGELNYTVVGGPTYLGDVIYELIHVDLTDREAYLLAGLDLHDNTWRIYYDSLADFGKSADDGGFIGIESATMAGLNGRLYVMGSNENETYNEEKDEYEVEISSAVYSCEPNLKGSTWKKEEKLPVDRTNGRAIVQGGKIYYILTNDEEGLIDYNIYEFDGNTWEAKGKLPKALFADSEGATIKWVGDAIWIILDFTDRIFCASGIDENGLIIAGKSFDGPGDTFRYNTKTGKIEPLKYSLWETISDREVDGVAAGNKMYVEYIKDSTEEAIGKSIPIKSGYVTLQKSITGEGSGSVIGGGNYTKGEKAAITITPDEGSYIYSVKVDGSNPKLDKKYGKSTAESRKAVTTTFNAVKDGVLEVYFGKISTKVIIPKSAFSRNVGTHKIAAYTDGTISGVKWTSSNRKYAKVNSDGTITFNRKGVGKTVTLTATSVENSRLKATCKVTIKSREKKKFKWYKKKLTLKVKAMIDWPLAKKYIPQRLKAKAQSGGKVKLSWNKNKNVSGYVVLRKTGKGRFVQIARLGKARKSYIDTKAPKGKKCEYMLVGYKTVKGSKAVRITKPSKVRKVTIK